MTTEWNEYKNILSELEPYQKWAKGQNRRFKKWMRTGKKRPASPYTVEPVLQGKSGLGPLEEVSYIPKIKEELNSDIWDESGNLKPEISDKLLTIAKDFYDKLDLPAPILDITYTRSSSLFSITP